MDIVKRDPKMVVIFYDGIKLFITEKQAIALTELSTKQDSFTLGGSMYKFAAMSKIIKEEDYYNQNPNERPANTQYFKSEEKEVSKYSPQRRIKALKRMVEGLDKSTKGKQLSSITLNMREKWINKIKEAEKEL